MVDGNLDQAAVGHTLKGETAVIAAVPCILQDAQTQLKDQSLQIHMIILLLCVAQEITAIW